MSQLALRALTQIGEALAAYRKHRTTGAEEPCEFEHPHPDHPCGRRIDTPYTEQETTK